MKVLPRTPTMAKQAKMTEPDEPLARRGQSTTDGVDPGNPVGEAWAVFVAAMDKWRLPVLERQLRTVRQESPPYRTD